MSISPKEVQEILSKPPYDEFIPFEKASLIAEDKPNYKEVEKRFGHIMMDLELNGEQKIATLEIPKEKRWDFYCDQIKDDHLIPSPEYLVDCILKKHDHRLLESLAINFSKNRISYRKKFLDANGLNLLVNYIKQFSIDPDSADNQKTMPHIFQCLQNIINSTKFGPSYFEDYVDEIFPILFELTVKLPFNNYFVLILSIISGCFISAIKGPMMQIITKTVKLLKRQPKIFWSNLKKVVQQNNPKNIQILVNFTQILILLRTNMKERFYVSIMFSVNEYMKSIRELSNPLFQNSISQFDSDCEILSQFSSHLNINPFSVKSLSKGLKENSKLKRVLTSILLSLNDILKNYETVSINQKAVIFIHNFLLIHRHYLANNDTSKLLLTAFSASENSDPIKVPYEGPNLSYRQLNTDSFFVNDSILKNSKMSDYGKIFQKMPDDSQIPVLKQKVEECKIYIEKLKDAHHVANAVRFEQDEILGQLKSLRAENNHLKAQVASLTEKLSKYEKGNKILRNSKDNSSQSNELVQLKSQVEELESQMIAENEKNRILNIQIDELKKKNENVANYSANDDVEQLKSQLEQTNNENKNLVSQSEEASNEINELKTKIKDLQKQLEESIAENKNLKQTTQKKENEDKSTNKKTISNFEEPNHIVTRKVKFAENNQNNEQNEALQSNNEITELKAQLEQSNQTIENLKKRLHLSESENDRLRNEEINSIKTQLESSSNIKRTSSENDDLNSSCDSTEFSSPIRSNNRSLTENKLILDQLSSQQQQIELLRKQLNEYESKDWEQLNPSYDLQNANSDEIQSLRNDLRNAKEQIEQYKLACNGDINSELKVMKVMKEQLNQKINENEELKMKLESTLIELNDFKEKSRQTNNDNDAHDAHDNSNDTHNNNNDSNDNNNNSEVIPKLSPPKRRFSFLTLLKK